MNTGHCFLENVRWFCWSMHGNSLHTYVDFWTWSVLSYDGAVLSVGLTARGVIILEVLQHMG